MSEQNAVTLSMAQRVIGRLTLEKEQLAELLVERDRDIAALRVAMDEVKAAIAGAQDAPQSRHPASPSRGKVTQ